MLRKQGVHEGAEERVPCSQTSLVLALFVSP